VSQLIDYFVCSRALATKWAEAMEQQDEALQSDIEAKMPCFVTLKNLGQDEVNILAACVEGDVADPAEAVSEIELVHAVSEEEGPWGMAFDQSVIEAIAGMSVEKALLQRWLRVVCQFRGGSEAYHKRWMSADAATKLKEMCELAVTKNMGLFTCFYG
jgi:hypothetical protein